jgi:FKBP-type peptidyl-prolyl cis-trans isomerase SlyD
MQKRVFSFNYTLKDTKGAVLDQSSDGPLVFLEGAGQIIPALEAKIIFMSPGDKTNVKLAAQDAYGLPDERLKMDVPKKELSHIEISIGSFLQLQLQDQLKVVQVTKITDDLVTLDGNHPLSGQDLEFDIEMVSVREASNDEIKHGHAHGPGGHHH